MKIDSTSDHDIYVFYGLSCESCTRPVIEFVKRGLSNEDNSSHYIFTDVQSRKHIDHLYGKISDHPRVTIDLHSKFYRFSYSEDFTFPAKLILKQGKI
ncbi:MAG TPA: hypothetical protein PKC30_01320 [Saprospiraceae bacterium]|nr:hypothetical protein [Saprospiraceae bacterium]